MNLVPQVRLFDVQRVTVESYYVWSLGTEETITSIFFIPASTSETVAKKQLEYEYCCSGRMHVNPLPLHLVVVGEGERSDKPKTAYLYADNNLVENVLHFPNFKEIIEKAIGLGVVLGRAAFPSRKFTYAG